MKELLEKALNGTIIGYVTGDKNSSQISFTTYDGDAPLLNELVVLPDSSVYNCDSVIDVTTDDEREEGLSYVKVTLTKVK